MIDVRLQPLKAFSPIDTTVLPLSNVADVNSLQNRKAFSPKDVNEFGIMIDFNLPQLRKALVPIETTLLTLSNVADVN
jgi:hypothetical protein